MVERYTASIKALAASMISMKIAGIESRFYYQWPHGGMAYTAYLKFAARKGLGVRVPLRLPEFVMKKKTSSIRNGFAISAKKRKAGEIRSKKDKRKNGKNKQHEYLSESHD